jgi:hypothetical protein
VEEHSSGIAGQAGVGFRGYWEWVAQLGSHLSHARPPEVDDNFPSEFGDEGFKLIRIKAFVPAHHSVFPPRHTGTVGVRFMTGIKGGAIRAHVLRTYKDYTHGIRFG